MTLPNEIGTVIEAFLPNTHIEDIKPLEIGHINPSYIVRLHGNASQGALFLQQLNAHVFRDPRSVIQNIQRVTEHLHTKLAATRQQDPGRRALKLVHTNEGHAFIIDKSGQFWRAYRYIEDTYSISNVKTPRQAHAAAAAFGEFINVLSDLPTPPLIETIERFHDTRWRFEEFMKAVKMDPLGRGSDAKKQIEFASSRETTAHALIELQNEGLVPLRPVHNDTKTNNILFDANSDEALCVVDLDTVMPGLVAHDFGDLVRSSIGDHAEDEINLSRIRLRMPVFTALAQGYLEGLRGLLLDSEIDSLATGVGVITLELGLRFLTDYLQGDHYFTPKRPSQNLQRARVQFRLLELIEQHAGELQAIVEESRSKAFNNP